MKVDLTVAPDPDQGEIVSFLKEIDNDVIPSLSSRLNLEEYSSKICRFSECVIARLNNNIIGLSAAYCNDLKTQKGFLTLIAVTKDCRCKGIATRLLNETIHIAKLKNMKKLILETSIQNKHAVSFYIKRGFNFANDAIVKTTDTVFMEYDIK